MGDLKIGNIPLGEVTLEKMNIHNKRHMNAMRVMRDEKAVEMCYDIYDDIDAKKRDEFRGNSFLVKSGEQYVGYMHISDEYEGERILAYIVEKNVRGRGLGKIMLTSVGNYLFECCDTEVLKLYINKNNPAGINLALGCGFEKTNVCDNVLRGYERRK